MYKSEFGMEEYLNKITDLRYRNALTRLRTSSHTLEIERGRYTTPKTPVSDRLCISCNVIENEFHFLINCKPYCDMRDEFYAKVTYIDQVFNRLSDREKYIYLMLSTDPYILKWLRLHRWVRLYRVWLYLFLCACGIADVGVRVLR